MTCSYLFTRHHHLRGERIIKGMAGGWREGSKQIWRGENLRETEEREGQASQPSYAI